MNTLTKSVILGFAIAGHSAAVATKKVSYKSYKIIGSSTCEAENMHTITDIGEYSTAGAALGQGNYRQKDGSALGRGIYTNKGTDRTKGCTFHGGVIEETGGVYRYSSSIDVNDGRRGIQLFPLARGSCGSANFWCICGIEAPQHQKSEGEGHDRGSGSGHGRDSHVKPPLPSSAPTGSPSASPTVSSAPTSRPSDSPTVSAAPTAAPSGSPTQHKKSEGEGHDRGSGSGHPEFEMDDSNFKMTQKREEGASEGVSAPTVALIGVAGFLAGVFGTFLVARCRSRRSNKGPTSLVADAVTPITNPETPAAAKPTTVTVIPGSAAGTVAVAVAEKV